MYIKKKLKEITTFSDLINTQNSSLNRPVSTKSIIAAIIETSALFVETKIFGYMYKDWDLVHDGDLLGFIYQQLDCHQIAATDYQYFIDQCPDDPASELLKSQVNAMNEKVVVVH